MNITTEVIRDSDEFIIVNGECRGRMVLMNENYIVYVFDRTGTTITTPYRKEALALLTKHLQENP